jgi:hypothetical protein
MRSPAVVRALAGAGALLALLGCSSSPASITTSIRERDCAMPPAEIAVRFEGKDLGVQQCEGAHGWDILVVSSDANSWIELRSARASWSSETAIVYEMPIGLFPGVQDESPLEWRSDGDELRALLFTVSAQDAADAETRITYVFVARFDDAVPVCVIGRLPSLTEARVLADSDASCPTA